jgi:hypothetical protein
MRHPRKTEQGLILLSAFTGRLLRKKQPAEKKKKPRDQAKLPGLAGLRICRVFLVKAAWGGES